MRRGGIAQKTITIAGGANRSATLAATADAVHFLNEAYKRCKPIAADDNAARLLAATYLYNKLPDANTEAARLRDGVIIGEAGTLAIPFIAAIKQHRFWDREKPRKVPA